MCQAFIWRHVVDPFLSLYSMLHDRCKPIMISAFCFFFFPLPLVYNPHCPCLPDARTCCVCCKCCLLQPPCWLLELTALHTTFSPSSSPASRSTPFAVGPPSHPSPISPFGTSPPIGPSHLVHVSIGWVHFGPRVKQSKVNHMFCYLTCTSFFTQFSTVEILWDDKKNINFYPWIFKFTKTL